MASRSIRIAMLNTDKPVPNILSQRGTFGSIFHNLLTAAAARVAPNVSIEAMEYDVRRGEYPICPAEIDIILITGSASSAYDSNLEWIHELDDYIFDTYTTYPHIKMFGACFGHQIICQSLLRAYGVVVEKDPNGWELGVKEIKLADEFRSKFAKTSTSASTAEKNQLIERLRLQMVHADHVRIPHPELLPSTWMLVGDTKHCDVQGVYEPGRVLTFQGHFEFDRFMNWETMKVFGATWEPELLKRVYEAIDADDDALAAAEIVVRFFMEASAGEECATRVVVGGLLTPPLQD